MKPTKQELLAENAELKRRLEEAEETLEALRRGAVEALVVYAPEGERVSTLRGAGQTYRHLVETINEGAATLTAAGDILYANGRLSEILALPLEQVIGTALREHIAEADQVFFDALFALAKKGESKGEVLLRTGGSALLAHLSFSSLHLAEAPGALSLVVTDLTRQKRQETLVADGRLSQEILLQAEQPIAVCDASGLIIRASRGLHRLCGQNPLLLPFQMAFPLKLPSDRPLLLAKLFQGTTLHNFEVNFRRPVDGRQFYLLLNTGPLLAEDLEVKGFVIAFTDITERRQAEAEKQAFLEKLQNSEEELQVLNKELQVVNEELQTQMAELQFQDEELRVLAGELHVQAEELRVANQEILAAHQSLLESDERRRRASRAGRVGLYEWNTTQDRAYWCLQAYKLFGLEPGSPANYERWLGCVHPQDRQRVAQNMTEVLEQVRRGAPQASWRDEYRVLHGDGTVLWLEATMSCEFDGDDLIMRGAVRDITERKQAEAALRESEERLRQAAQAGRMFAFEWNPSTDAVSRSPEAGAILGLSGEAAIHDTGQGFFAKIFPEDGDAFVEMLHNLKPESDRYTASYRIIQADTGQVIWLEEIAQGIFDAKGKLQRLFGMAMDVTARKQAEEALRRSNQRLDLLAESASRLLASEAPQEVVGTICPKVMEFLDCDVFFNFLLDEQEERLHLNAWAGIPDAEADRIERLDYGTAVCDCAAQDGCQVVAADIQNTRNPLTELLQTQGIQAYTCHPLLIGGRALGTLSFGSRRRDHFSDDDLGLMKAVADQVAVAMDRQIYEAALRESGDRERARAMELQAILDAVPIPVFISCDPSPQTITGNLAACEVLHLPPGSNVSLSAPRDELPPYRAVADGRELPPEELPMQRALTGQRVRNQELDLILADGSIRHVSINAIPILDDAGQVRGGVGALLDLTERRQAQEALRRAYDDLEERVQERTAVLRFTVAQLQEEVTERLRAEAELTKQTELVHDLYNNAPCGYHSLDKEGFFVRINDTELAWLGYNREEVLGRMNFEDLLTPESVEIFRQTFPVLMERGWVRDLEYELIRKDGSVLPVLLSATALRDEAGNFLMGRSSVYDITARQRAEVALRESQERLRFLAGQLLTVQEQERKRLAAELHDELGHALLTLKLSLGSIARKLLPEQENIQELLQDQLEYINHVINEVRRLYHDLSPGDLEDLGLTKALKYLIEEFAKMQPDISWVVELPDLAGRFTVPVQIIIYRLVQEALTNIGKHAEPTQVRIIARAEDGQVRLVIEDNGQGFDMSEVDRDPNRGIGLAAMGERLYIVGGSLEIRTQAGQGTRLTFTVPTLAEG